jgi:predicted nucleic acid-binding protein
VPLVVDASALVVAVVGTSAPHRSLRRRLADEVCHAPHLIDADFGNVLRRHALRGELAASDAASLLATGLLLVDHRYEMTESLGRAAWALRENLTFYDALYAALAGVLRFPLLTGDARLLRTPGLSCEVELA